MPITITTLKVSRQFTLHVQTMLHDGVALHIIIQLSLVYTSVQICQRPWSANTSLLLFDDKIVQRDARINDYAVLGDGKAQRLPNNALSRNEYIECLLDDDPETG